jgi:N-acetylmuramoyl-L-alanine amidase
VRNYLLLLAFFIVAVSLPLASGHPNQGNNQATPPLAAQPQPPQAQPTLPPQQEATPAAAPAATPVQAVAPSGPVVVLDPAHGGTDTGARGATGAAEKDIVLQYARTVRAELVAQNVRVVTTRDDDSNPSYDARATIANGYRDAIFISIHISSTGKTGTARAYYYQFSNPSSSAPITPTAAETLELSRMGFLPWAQAQKPFADESHLFADILQRELGLRFAGSPATSSGVAIRGLQSVTAPAIAVEISSISAPDPNSLLPLAGSLATAISHAVLAFRPPGSAEGK